jgi:hypothetical protein
MIVPQGGRQLMGAVAMNRVFLKKEDDEKNNA